MIVTDLNYNETITNNKLVLLDFSATWCAPCRALLPIIDRLIQANPDVVIGKVDIDENNDLTRKFNIRSVPTLIYIKDGVVVGTDGGVQPFDKIQNKLDSLK